MNSRSILLGLGLACVHAAPTNAQSANMDNLSAIAMMNGRCSQLVLGGKDASEACQGKLTNSIYKTGRSGFTFLAGDLAIVTFSGADSPAKGDMATIRLDKIIFTLVGAGTPPNVVAATGSCTYTNPYAGPSHVNCSASTKNGRFSGSFVSDGGEPDIQRF